MRHENMIESLDLARRQSRDVAEIEHDRALSDQHLDIECRIARSPIEQGWVQERTHVAA